MNDILSVLQLLLPLLTILKNVNSHKPITIDFVKGGAVNGQGHNPPQFFLKTS
jgi:hypothetical protein